LPTSVTLDNVIGLDALLLGFDLSGAPASTLQLAASSATALATAVPAGNPAAAVTALIGAPAVIANGHAAVPYALNPSNLTAPVAVFDAVANVSVVENLPLDGVLVHSGLRRDGDGDECA
jgi:hypothetical protein